MAGIAASLVRMLASATRRTTGEVPVRDIPSGPILPPPAPAAGHIARSKRPRKPAKGTLAWHEAKATEAWNLADAAAQAGDDFLAACLYDCWRLNVEIVQARQAGRFPVTIPL